jgi:hypothetical protein
VCTSASADLTKLATAGHTSLSCPEPTWDSGQDQSATSSSAALCSSVNDGIREEGMPTKRYMNRGASRMSSHIVSSKRYSASNAKRGGAPARPEYRPPTHGTSSTKCDTRAGAAKPIGRQARLQRRLQSRGDAECATHRAGRPTSRPRPPRTRLPARSPEVSKPRRRDHLKAMSDEISGTCQALVPPAAGSVEDKDG